MATQVVHRDNCRLCLSKNVEIVVHLQPIPLAEKYTLPDEKDDNKRYPIDLYMCRDCGHVQLLDVIDSDTLWDDYTYHSGQTKGIVDHFKEVASNVISKHHPEKGSLVIDIGSNDGSLLRQFKDVGHKVLGVDPAKDIARKATESGIETIPSLMTLDIAKKIREENGGASVVTAFNVFAHTDDMGGMADCVRTMLADDGVFIFEVQYLLDIIDKVLLGTVFHEHMSHHSMQPMDKFLRAHGMELIDIERVNIQKGSVIGTAQPLNGPRKIGQSVIDLLALEKERELDKPESVKKFAEKLSKMEDQTKALVAEWKKDGKVVAGFGAARSGPTLIAQFGFGDVIQYVFDDHPQKVNKLTPGDRIPVVPTSELNKRKPDYVVVLAWIHAKNIIASNQEYLDGGGKFVVVCPEVQVIGKDTKANLI